MDKPDKDKTFEVTTYTCYANSAQLKVSIYDFEIRFGVASDKGEHINLCNVTMSPQHTKVLTMLLNKHIKVYEDKFSEIVLPDEITKDYKVNGNK